MGNRQWWRSRYAVGIVTTLFILGFFLWIELLSRNGYALNGGWWNTRILFGGIALSILVIFIRPLRRLLYPLMPFLWLIGFGQALAVMLIAPGNWVHLGMFLQVFASHFMYTMYRNPLPKTAR